MNEKIIEPSEIITGKAKESEKEASHVNPWIRFLSRFMDYSLFCLVLLISRKFFHGSLPLRGYDYFIPFEYFLWIPIETLLLTFLGTTPGKWFLRTRIRLGNRKRFDFFTALTRSFAVWIRGMGMGIFGVNFLCMLTAFNKLKVYKMTTWDREDHIQVTHFPIGVWRIFVAVFIALGGLLYYMHEKEQSIKHDRKVVRSIHEHSSSPHLRARLYFPAKVCSCSWSHRNGS